VTTTKRFWNTDDVTVFEPTPAHGLTDSVVVCVCVCVRGTWAIGVFSDDFRSCRLVRNGYPGTRNPSGFRPNVFKRELPPVRRRRIIETTSNGPFRAAYPAHEIKPIRRTPPAARQTPFIVFIIIIAVTFRIPNVENEINNGARFSTWRLY